MYTGIRVKDSEGLGVSANILSDINGYGLILSSVHNSSFSNNSFEDSFTGISVHSSHHNVFENNTFSSHISSGIYLKGSCANILRNNDLTNCASRALFVETCNATLLENNNCTDSWIGIELSGGGNITILDSSCSGNQDRDIVLSSTRSATLSGNTMTGGGLAIRGDIPEYWNTHDIDTHNTIHGKPIYYYAHESGITISEEGGQIILVNCSSVTIRDQDISGMDTGITLKFSDHTTIAGNRFNENVYDIYLSGSTHNLIENNSFEGSERGLYLEDSHNNTMKGNVLGNCSRYGLYLFGSHGNLIKDTRCVRTCLYGVYLEDSSNNTLRNVSCIDGRSSGIMLRYSRDNLISNSCCKDNGGNGIYLMTDSPGNHLRNNSCQGNTQIGIQIAIFSDDSLLENNTCWENGMEGILVEGYNVVLENNRLMDNAGSGISFHNCRYAHLSNNTIHGLGITISGPFVDHWNTHELDDTNTVNGAVVCYLKNTNDVVVPANAGQVIVVNCTYSTIANLKMENCGMGLLLAYSDHNTIEDNSFSNSSLHGISLQHSRNNIIRNNSCVNNSGSGIFVYSSSGNRIMNNRCYGNGKNGISLSHCEGSLVINNSCFENQETGIYLYWVRDGARVRNNTCVNNDVSGITCSSTAGIGLHMNTCSKNQNGIILYYSTDVIIIGARTVSNNIGIKVDGGCEGIMAKGALSNNLVMEKVKYLIVS